MRPCQLWRCPTSARYWPDQEGWFCAQHAPLLATSDWPALVRECARLEAAAHAGPAQPRQLRLWDDSAAA